ncbi:unnamed protein product, partial [Prorocentrum cordatum]
MAMPTGLWSRTRAAAPRRTGTRAGATCRTRKWRECGSCNCMTEWNYDGDADGVMESYEGCSATADWDQSWCYVQGGSNCNQALNSTVAGETRKWRECGSCNCMTEWNYDGDADGVMESYEGCSATADW